MGTDPATENPRTAPGSPFPRRPIIGLPASRLKDARGAADGGRAPPGP